MKAKSNTAIEITWKKGKGAGYYDIYRSTKKTGKYKKIAGTKKTTYLDKKCKKNTKYYYKVCARVSKSETERKSPLSEAASACTKNIPGKVVFAGDSIMEGVSAYHVLKEMKSPGKKSVVAHRGLGTLSFQTNGAFHGETAVDTVIAKKPDRLYLMLGMNEISYRKMGDMLKNYSEIIQQIKDESPKTEIVILAVSPVTRATALKRKGFSRITEWNKQLKKFAKDKDCRFFDYTKALKGSDGYLKYNGGDGIHWPISGYRAFIRQIDEYEKKINR